MKTLAVLFAFFLAMASSFCHAQTTTRDIDPLTDIVTLYGDVDPSSAYQVVTRLQMLEDIPTTKPIYLLIDSPGGGIIEGGMIVSAIQSSRRPVYTVDVGRAESMGAIIFSYGKHRYMFPHSVLMLHDASGKFPDDAQQALSRAKFVKQMYTSYLGCIEQQTGLTEAQLLTKLAPEWWLIPSEAVKVGLADSVITLAKYPVPGAPE